VRRLISRFWADSRGATAIEYALIAAGISIVIAGVVTTLGTSVSGQYTSVSDALK
jgi:pilus assembly protein Flp/PilA